MSDSLSAGLAGLVFLTRRWVALRVGIMLHLVYLRERPSLLRVLQRSVMSRTDPDSSVPGLGSASPK